MLHELRQFISEKQLFSSNEKILLAVSGGIDSIVLFDLFLKAGFSFAVAHCNFSLRSSESDADEQFVSDLAIKHGISIHVKRFDTSTFATNNALSIQMAARELRYTWFEEIAQKYSYSSIATAHQLNDMIETMFINLSRGTGIAGLHGIPEKNGNVIRPLLFAGREKINAYAEENGLAWREDSSNIEEKYARNLIRHKIVPVLKKLNPNLEEVFKQNTERFKGTEQLFKHHIQQYRKELLLAAPNGYSITIARIDATPAPFTILTELLIPFGFNFSTIQTIYKNRFQGPGATYYSPGFMLQKDRLNWLLSPTEDIADFEFAVYPESTHTVPTGTIHFQTISIESFKGFSNDQNIAYIDADKIQWPLTIRNWLDGDKFYPFGMQGMKKVSDFLIDLKIPVSLKKKIPILLNKGEIVWVVGFRTDKMYKITDSTKKILIATFTPLIQEPDNII